METQHASVVTDVIPTVVEGIGLSKNYGPVQALKGVDFSIREGECFGFLGHNGAGKSTTMRMIYGLSRVDSGELTVLGKQVRGVTDTTIKAQLGVVPQEDSLDPDLTVLENLEMYGGFFGLSSGEARRRGRELLSFMEMSEKMNDHVETLSGGLKRRLVIARALINDPRLVILDEPTTGLDPQARRLVWQKLRQLKEQGTTLILTTHYLEEAAQLCDRLVILHKGEILAEGTPTQLVAEYLPPQVIEVHLPTDRIPEGLAMAIAQAGAKVEEIAGQTFIFTGDGEDLWRRVGEFGLPQHCCYLRATSLEDVFLYLAGREEN